jgi:hypothetical protein
VNEDRSLLDFINNERRENPSGMGKANMQNIPNAYPTFTYIAEMPC